MKLGVDKKRKNDYNKHYQSYISIEIRFLSIQTNFQAKDNKIGRIEIRGELYLNTCRILAFCFAAVSAAMDLEKEKISNWWIGISWLTGFAWHTFSRHGEGVLFFLSGSAIPVIALFLLFALHMLGAGDVKLLSCLGGIMGSTDIWTCIFISFFIGSLFSIAILSICGNIFQRFQYFMNYIGELFRKKERIPYRLPGMQQENFHFTIPILMSVMLYTGGVY